jgi:hypothetical protein
VGHYSRTSEAKDCSQNANLHRPLMDIGMLEKSGFVKQLFVLKCTIAEPYALLLM